MTDKDILALYVKIAEFISLCFSRDVEVLVHDVEHLDNSTIAIFNSHVSGRDKGAPMPHLGRSFMKNEDYREKDWVVNYKGVTDKGVIVRSSTFFIRNPKGEFIGALCVNVDIRKYEALKQLVDSMIDPDPEPARDELEFLNTSVSWQMNKVISDFCTRTGRLADEFSKSDRVDILRELYRQDFFERKGAISEVAERLDISEPSVYRYLKNIKRESSAC